MARHHVCQVADTGHLDMSRWPGVSLTFRQQVVRVRLVKFGEQDDKRTALQQPIVGRKCYGGSRLLHLSRCH